MDWLLSALSRHLAQRVLLRNRSETWIEFNEYELVRCLEAVFTGLGYDVFPEWKAEGRRIDLRAQSPTSGENDPEFLVEAKFIWDPGDKRLCEERLPEVLKDFGPLQPHEGTHSRHLVVWLVQSSERNVVSAREGAKSLRLGDVVALVEREHGRMLAEPVVLDAGELWKGKLQYRFMHLYAWEPGTGEGVAPELSVSRQRATGDWAENATRDRLRSLGLEAEKPYPDLGVDLEVWDPKNPGRRIGIQVKGRGRDQADGNYRHFQIRTKPSEIAAAVAEDFAKADAWKRKARLCEFFVLVSQLHDEFWVFPTPEIHELVAINSIKYKNWQGTKSGTKVELNLEIKHEGRRLTDIYEKRRNNFGPLLEMLNSNEPPRT